MAKSLRLLKDIKFDIAIQVVDARAVHISDSEFEILKNKIVIKVALKSDLADVKNKAEGIFYLSSNEKNFRQKLIKIIDEKLQPNIKKMQSKGLVNPTFSILVLGLPNIGKSTLINKLIGSNKLIAANSPGVTKRNKLIKITNMYYMYDTPGIMFKKIDNDSDGYVLSLLNTINNNIIPIGDVVEYAFNFYKKCYLNKMVEKFNINANTNFNDFISLCCAKYNLKTKENKEDSKSCYDFLFHNFKDCVYFPVNYESY
jgi:ribosome biogenesis GTPase A